jgi:hypothetical protein
MRGLRVPGLGCRADKRRRLVTDETRGERLFCSQRWGVSHECVGRDRQKALDCFARANLTDDPKEKLTCLPWRCNGGAWPSRPRRRAGQTARLQRTPSLWRPVIPPAARVRSRTSATQLSAEANSPSQCPAAGDARPSTPAAHHGRVASRLLRRRFQLGQQQLKLLPPRRVFRLVQELSIAIKIFSADVFDHLGEPIHLSLPGCGARAVMLRLLDRQVCAKLTTRWANSLRQRSYGRLQW